MQGAPPGLVYVDYLESDGQRGFQHACQMGLEGIVAAICAKWRPDDDRA
jgi:ATP-dependent DNA ligase